MKMPKAKVLAIEDASGTIMEIAGDLKDALIQVDFAPTISDTERLLKAQKYDVLLVDVMLIGSDGQVAENGGLEVIHKLRSGEYGQENLSTPFFILTGQKASLDEATLASIPGCLGVEKKLLQYRLLGKIKARIDETKTGG